jgi:hypothetical protein
MYHVVPANRDHQHQRTTNSVGWTYGNQSSPAVQAMAHEHEMSGALQPSYDAWNPAYGADNSMCNYNYGIYFIQKVA